MAKNDDRHTEVLEEGDIFFLYRLEVEEEPSGLGDVQRFYVVLRPQAGKLRLLVMERKRLPDVEQHERNWGFVDIINRPRMVKSRHPVTPLLKGTWE